MADDIEQILQQVESELFNANSERKTTTVKPSRRISLVRTPDPEISQLLEDLQSPVLDRSSRSIASLISNQDSGREQKCFPLMLGAADTPTGLSTVQNQRSCDNLRCTFCDRSIIAMPHARWLPQTDALFLRQAAVQPTHLSAMLELEEGARAYACQCKCFTVTQGNQSIPPSLPWVCARHSN